MNQRRIELESFITWSTYTSAQPRVLSILSEIVLNVVDWWSVLICAQLGKVGRFKVLLNLER